MRYLHILYFFDFYFVLHVILMCLQLHLSQVTMPRLSAGKDGLTDKRQLEWEAAVEAVIRDITSPTTPQAKPPIVQIVIYESSV